MGQRSSFQDKGQQRSAKNFIFQLFFQDKVANSNEIWKDGKKGNDK